VSVSRRVAALITLAGMAFAAGACGGTSATLAQRLRAWESGASYSVDQDYITSDISDIARGLRSGQLAKARTACDGLYYDAGSAEGELPTPDEALTTALNDEYENAANAAESCSLASTLNGGRMARYRLLVGRATRALDAARRRGAQILSG
jgi:hypothetical protein